jgi:tetratricopeptide (TPR) repeat protein
VAISDSFVPELASWATPLAFATTVLWELHPLNTEAVNYLTQRTELMMSIFYLLTLYASVRALRSNERTLWQAIAMGSCAAGMACKESMVTAPLMVVLYDAVFVFKSIKSALSDRWRFYVGLAASWVLLAALNWSGPRVHSAGFSTDVHPWTYLLNQTIMLTQYLRRAVWPRSLVFDYGWPATLTLGDVFPYALFVAALLGLTCVALARTPRLGFLGAWFFITLAPTSSIVPIATEVGAERRMYLPLLAIVALAVIAAVSRWSPLVQVANARAAQTRVPALAGSLLLVTVSTALALTTAARNREYRSLLLLAQTVVDRYPTNSAHHLLAVQLVAAGRQDEAMRHLRQSLPGAPRAHYTLGAVLLDRGQLDEAISELQAFIREQPYLLEAISARQLLGQAFARQGRWADAIEQYRTVFTMNPSAAERTAVLGLLAEALFSQQSYDEAIVNYRAYLERRPTDGGAFTNLALALAATDRFEEALVAFRRAVEIDPRNGAARRNLANALFDHHDIDEAVVQAREAVALRPNDPAAHELYGRALAMHGDLSGAVSEFERSLQIDPNYPDARQNLRRIAPLVGASGGGALKAGPLRK